MLVKTYLDLFEKIQIQHKKSLLKTLINPEIGKHQMKLADCHYSIDEIIKIANTYNLEIIIKEKQ